VSASDDSTDGSLCSGHTAEPPASPRAAKRRRAQTAPSSPSPPSQRQPAPSQSAPPTPKQGSSRTSSARVAEGLREGWQWLPRDGSLPNLPPSPLTRRWRGGQGLFIEGGRSFQQMLRSLVQDPPGEVLRTAEADPRLPHQFALDAFRDPAIICTPDADGVPRAQFVSSLRTPGLCEQGQAQALRQVGDWLSELCDDDAELTKQVAWTLSQNTLNGVAAALANWPIFFHKPSRLAAQVPLVPLFHDRKPRVSIAQLAPQALDGGHAPFVVQVTMERFFQGPIQLWPSHADVGDDLLSVAGELTQLVHIDLFRHGNDIKRSNLHVALHGQLAGDDVAVQLYP
jgi:hypothetical protein